MTGDPLQFSRPVAAAMALGDAALDRHRFIQKRVLLTGDTDILLTSNGHEIFRAAFLLLIRICRDVSIALPGPCAELKADIEALAQHTVADYMPAFLDDKTDNAHFDAVLSVGCGKNPGATRTTINSDGWLARVSSGATPLPKGRNRTNAIGAFGAACLGVAEVFKRLIALRDTRGQLLNGMSFSLWTYKEESTDIGPDLDLFSIDVLLVGCGAIGSGTAYLLSRLPISGRAIAIDRQDYRRENFGTSITVGEKDYERPKAQVVAELLRTRLTTDFRMADIAQYQVEYDGHHPDVVLAGLDDIDPRHAVQQIWPALVIDGAVGGELSCQVSCHPWPSDIACLLCVFQKPPMASLDELTARATGLPAGLTNDPDALVTEDVIAAGPAERRSWLRSHLGKRICSITSEAVTKFLGQ